MAKIKNHTYVKELGGAIKHTKVSDPVKVLQQKKLIRGRVLDYGCGHGFDADALEWDGYDPHYRQKRPVGPYDTIVCNHVCNILTRGSRLKLYEDINTLLGETGSAYLIVSRRIPENGKMGLRKRIQNWVNLTLPSIYFLESEYEIYRLDKDAEFEDKTKEFEDRLGERRRK